MRHHRSTLSIVAHLGMVLLLMVVSAGVFSGSATAGPSPAVSPSKVAVIDPVGQGEDLRLPDLNVSNGGDEPGQFRMDLSHFGDQSERVPDSSWIRFSPERFRLEPGATQSVIVRLAVPREADVGEYRIFLRAIAGPEEAQEGVAVIGAVAVTLTFSVENRNFHFYDPLVDFFQDRSPFSYLGVSLIGGLAIAYLFQRRFRIRIGFGVERRE